MVLVSDLVVQAFGLVVDQDILGMAVLVDMVSGLDTLDKLGMVDTAYRDKAVLVDTAYRDMVSVLVSVLAALVVSVVSVVLAV